MCIRDSPKAVKRFQGEISGLGTDKDEEILSWAFNKERKIGDVDIKTTGNGDYIVFYLNGKQEAGIADPESVREQIEPVVKNKLIAKKIIEKINASKATSLDAVAKLFATTKQSDQVNLFTPSVGAVSYTHLDVYKRQLLHQYQFRHLILLVWF